MDVLAILFTRLLPASVFTRLLPAAGKPVSMAPALPGTQDQREVQTALHFPRSGAHACDPGDAKALSAVNHSCCHAFSAAEAHR